MSGQCLKQSPGAASFGRGYAHPLLSLLFSLFLIMGTSTIANALVPSGYYPDDDPAGVFKQSVRDSNITITTETWFGEPANEPAISACGRKSGVSDADVSESIFTAKSELDVRPELIWMRQPGYPGKTDIMTVEGRVLLHVLVGETGIAKEVRIIEEYPAGAGFGQSCLAVARKAVYSPGIKDDKPVKCWLEIPVVFKSR